MDACVAVLGAYGDVGSVACRELSRRPELQLILGGRDESRAAALAKEIGNGAKSVGVDLFDGDQLTAFVESADIVLNCAGPSDAIGNLVADAAVAARRHLIDVGGDERTFGELAGRWREPVDRDVLVLLDAGWIPGVSGALARLVDERAASTLDRVDRLALYCGDRQVWSATGMADVLAVARNLGTPGRFEGDSWVELRGRDAIRRVRLPVPFGSRIAVPAHLGELQGLASRNPERPVQGHLVPLLGPAASVAFFLGIGPLRVAPGLAARLLAQAAQLDVRSHGGGGVVAAVANGERAGRPAAVRGVAITYNGPLITGRCAALTVAALARGELQTRGCEYLCDAIEPRRLLEELAGPDLSYAVTA